MNVVKMAKNSAVRLVQIILQFFPHFRDTAVYKGRLIHFYKRAQILVGDVWAAFGKPTDTSHPCYFPDINNLTMFADYRVPQLLRALNIFEYTTELSHEIDSLIPIAWGSEKEVELRAQTVIAVDLIQKSFSNKGINLLVIECDWLLWQRGEQIASSMLPHHRTLAIYY